MTWHGSVPRLGKKGKAWETERRRLKIKFERMGVTECEADFMHDCWVDNGLSFAHSKKRADIRGEELSEVALLCPTAHKHVESLPKEEMCNIIRRIIAKRNQ